MKLSAHSHVPVKLGALQVLSVAQNVCFHYFFGLLPSVAISCSSHKRCVKTGCLYPWSGAAVLSSGSWWEGGSSWCL